MTGCAAVALVASVFAASAAAQATASVDPVALVRRAVELRLEEEKSHRPVRYVLRKTDGNHETTKEIIETKDGDVARLIAINGQPLTPEQEQAEMNRLDALSRSPEMQERRRRSEQKDAARIDQLVGMLPDSELYHLEGMVSCGASQCYRLSFAPNPKFETPNIEADVLRGFAGEVWIEETQQRLVRLDAHLVKEVTVGFGILGRLDKGGSMQLQQEYEGTAEEWQPTVLKMNLSGKALMVKTVNIRINEVASDFTPVPPELGYRDAIAMLKKPATVAEQR
ncbi:MAG TPA: hypothetical protein VK814_01965 [Acidobacteriaceae bacterium]|nr:hypothetical protein [Acidobacteriaceae bacterium]